LFSSYFL
jgi:hypothetical protein